MAATVGAMLDADPAVRRVADQIGAVRVMGGMWRYRDPGGLLIEELDLPRVPTAITTIGGNEVYDLVNVTAGEIQAGTLDAALVVSAEVLRTIRRARAAGEEITYRPEADDAAPDVRYGSTDGVVDPQQKAAGATDPVAFYAMAEVALRHARGEDVADHQARIAALWATASDVAADNRHAWLQRRLTAAEIERPTEGNRMVASPYPKLMTSNVDVDQSAAVLLCSYRTAVDAGIDPGAMVFPIAGAGAADHLSLAERWSLAESPAMRAAGSKALALAGWSTDDVDDLDLYSCFPAAVQVAQDALGLDPTVPFTITGGLTFAGGPFNSYCLHALATAVERLRDGASHRTLLSGNGGYFSKHSFLTLASAPGDGFRSERPQAEVDAGPRRPVAAGPLDRGTLEAYTVLFDRSGTPSHGLVAALDGEGARHWATTADEAAMRALLADDLIGKPITARSDGAEAPVVTAIG